MSPTVLSPPFLLTAPNVGAALALAAAAVAATYWVQRRAAAAARVEREWLAVTLRSIGDAVIATDAAGVIRFLNPAAEALAGWRAEAVTGQPVAGVFRLVTENTGAALENPVAAVLTGGGAGVPAARAVLLGNDGQTRVIETTAAPIRGPDGRLLGAVLVFRDATAKREAERALEANEGLFRSAFDHTNVAMVVTDMAHRFVRVNAAFARLFGRRPGDMLGVSMQDVTHPDDVAESLARRRDLLAAGGSHFDMEKRYAGPGGKELWGLTNVSLVRGADGAPLRYVDQVQDITDRKRAEEALRLLNAELEERVEKRTAELSAANEELEAFSYSVSHDLRAPLRAIDGFARIVLEDFVAGLPPDAVEYLTDIRAASLRMGRLVDDLLAFSRLGRQVVKKYAVATGPLVRQCLDELADPRPPENLAVRVAELPPCVADAALLKQVWLNLLGNALKYTGKKDSAVVEVGCRIGPGAPAYFVRDNGVGFDMKYAHKLFGVFHRMHREEDYTGTGVGLAIVSRVVHRHGGRVWAEAAPDKGATFFFTLEPDQAAEIV